MRGPSDWSSSTGTGGGSSRIGGLIVGGLIMILIVGIIFVVLAVTLLPLFVGFNNPIVSTLVFTLPWLLPFMIMGGVFLIIVISLLTANKTEQATPGESDDTFEATFPAAQPADPLKILKERYASGEISVEEYERAVGLLVDVDTAEEAHRRLERGDHEEVIGLEHLIDESDSSSGATHVAEVDEAEVTVELTVEEIEALIDEISTRDG